MILLTCLLCSIQFILLIGSTTFTVSLNGRSLHGIVIYLSVVFAVLTLLSLSYVNLEYTIYLGILYLIIYSIYFLIKILGLITE
jgi:hypothetical protein